MDLEGYTCDILQTLLIILFAYNTCIDLSAICLPIVLFATTATSYLNVKPFTLAYIHVSNSSRNGTCNGLYIIVVIIKS